MLNRWGVGLELWAIDSWFSWNTITPKIPPFYWNHHSSRSIIKRKTKQFKQRILIEKLCWIHTFWGFLEELKEIKVTKNFPVYCISYKKNHLKHKKLSRFLRERKKLRKVLFWSGILWRIVWLLLAGLPEKLWKFIATFNCNVM